MGNWKILKENKNDDVLTINIGVDDPAYFEIDKIDNEVLEYAEKQGYPTFLECGEIMVFGQNQLAEKEYKFSSYVYLDKDDMLGRVHPNRSDC